MIVVAPGSCQSLSASGSLLCEQGMPFIPTIMDSAQSCLPRAMKNQVCDTMSKSQSFLPHIRNYFCQGAVSLRCQRNKLRDGIVDQGL